MEKIEVIKKPTHYDEAVIYQLVRIADALEKISKEGIVIKK